MSEYFVCPRCCPGPAFRSEPFIAWKPPPSSSQNCAVRRYDGYIVQSTDDGIFALFGAPVAREDHPQRALYAALRMQEEMRRYSARLRGAGHLPVEARVGTRTATEAARNPQ